MVRAKFTVNSKSEPREINQWLNDIGASGIRDVVDIQMTPVSSGSLENNQFYASTPTGSITLSTVNVKAADYFVVNKQYYVDFTEA